MRPEPPQSVFDKALDVMLLLLGAMTAMFLALTF
jgi:hypothetical protein